MPAALYIIRDNTIPIRVANFAHKEKTLYAGTRLGTVHAVTAINYISPNNNEAQSGLEIITETVEKNTLSKEQRQQMIQFLRTHKNAFALSEFDLGHTSVVKHTIPLIEGTTPIKQRPYRVPYKLQEECRRQVKNMVDHGVIRPSISPWIAPVVLVKKKDGSVRFCVDYRKLNAVTVKDTYPLPRIDEMLDKLGKSKFFSTIDLASGYWQIEIAEEDREKTAFSTGEGLYEFNVLPFGLTTAPSTFQRTLEFILMDVAHCLVYIDDVIVFSETFEDHLKELTQVFKRLEYAKMKLKPSKCEWAKPEVTFLGHRVSAEGVKPDPRNTEKVDQFPTPKTVKNVQEFLGLTSYYRRFVKDFATIAGPLHSLLKKIRNLSGHLHNKKPSISSGKDSLTLPL